MDVYPSVTIGVVYELISVSEQMINESMTIVVSILLQIILQMLAESLALKLPTNIPNWMHNQILHKNT